METFRFIESKEDNFFVYRFQQPPIDNFRKRLNTIKQITKCLYVYQEPKTNKIFWLTEEPANVLETMQRTLDLEHLVVYNLLF
jgi:hypothetical protein